MFPAAKVEGVSASGENVPVELVALPAVRPLSLASEDWLDPLGGVPATTTHSLGSWSVSSLGFALSARICNW